MKTNQFVLNFNIGVSVKQSQRKQGGWSMCVYGGPALKHTREMELKHLQIPHTVHVFLPTGKL